MVVRSCLDNVIHAPVRKSRQCSLSAQRAPASPANESVCHYLSSVPLGLQVQYYDSLNTLVLFILLGIGADGLFVYFDAFRQSEMHPEHCATLGSRITYTVERAAQATLVTSFTTAASFLSTYVSRMIPVAAFGVFAFTCMVMLYVATTLLIPPALVIWYRHFSLLPFGVCSKWCPCVDKENVRFGVLIAMLPLHTFCLVRCTDSFLSHFRQLSHLQPHIAIWSMQ